MLNIIVGGDWIRFDLLVVAGYLLFWLHCWLLQWFEVFRESHEFLNQVVGSSSFAEWRPKFTRHGLSLGS